MCAVFFFSEEREMFLEWKTFVQDKFRGRVDAIEYATLLISIFIMCSVLLKVTSRHISSRTVACFVFVYFCAMMVQCIGVYPILMWAFMLTAVTLLIQIL